MLRTLKLQVGSFFKAARSTSYGLATRQLCKQCEKVETCV